MDRQGWQEECSRRLQEHWEHIDPEQLDEVAGLLYEGHAGRFWNKLPPREAAETWLRLGMPNVF